LKHHSLTLTTAFACILLGALLAPAAAAFDKQVPKAIAASDWNTVVELVGPTLKPGADISGEILMVYACRASNRNNSAEQQLNVDPSPDNRVAWLHWADTLLAAYPENPAVLTLWGDARYRAIIAKDYKQEAVSRSLASVSRAIDFDEDYALAYKVRGDIYLADRRFEHALADFKKALELDPKMVEAQFNLAVVYEKEEDFDQALVEYGKTLALSPGFAKALTFRGAAYREKGNMNDAIKDCNAALKADPTYVMAHFVKAMAYSEADMKEMATNCFKDFIASAPPKMGRMARNAVARIKLLEEQP
jgi:tetratricopeptide (TPR) repeat protein